MAVSSVASLQNKLSQSLVAARGAKGPFTNALASATSVLNPASSSDANQIANQQNYTQSLSNLQGKLNQWFQAAGVDTSHEIQLSLTADGTVQLANDHPDAAQIQQLLSSHPELGGMLQSLSNSYKQLNPSASTDSTSQFTVTLSGGMATASMTG